MDYKEFKDAVSRLEWASYNLEETYAENGGEVTEDTEKMEAEIEAIQDLLSTDGVDFLGRWLKGKEDKKKSLKAEKDYITRQMEAIDKTIDFIKAQIRRAMELSGSEKVKGMLGYSFALSTSTKTEVDKDVLKDIYAERVEKALRDAFIPSYIGVSLTASSTKAAEYGGCIAPGDEKIFVTTETPTVRFRKPVEKKEA